MTLDLTDTAVLYLDTSTESLTGVEMELENQGYNNDANRASCACFQVAVAALIGNQVRPRSLSGQWSHGFVPDAFATVLKRRKLWSPDVRDTLTEIWTFDWLDAEKETRVPETDPTTTARERLRLAGVPEEQIPVLLERAAQLVAGLAALAALDPELPEPGLIWQPIAEVTR